jgi:hypothetical protein
MLYLSFLPRHRAFVIARLDRAIHAQDRACSATDGPVEPGHDDVGA